MNDRIDIHDTKTRFRVALENFRTDYQVSDRNRDTMTRFLRECRLGKTIKGRAKKKIMEARLLKYLYLLKKMSLWLDEPLDEVNQDQIDRLVMDIEDDVLQGRNDPFAEETKID